MTNVLHTTETRRGRIQVELAPGTTDTLILRSLASGQAYEILSPGERAEGLRGNGIDPRAVEVALSERAAERNQLRADLVTARDALATVMMGRGIDHSIEVGGPLSGGWIKIELSPQGAERLAELLKGSK